MTPARPVPLSLAFAGLLVAGCAITAPTTPVRPLHHHLITIPTASVPPWPPVGHQARARTSASSARMVVARFAAAYPRYLNGRVPARQLPGLSVPALSGLEQTRPRAIRLRPVAIAPTHDGWTVRYHAATQHRRGTVTARLTLAPSRGGWQIMRVDPPDLDQLTATHHKLSLPPAALRSRAVAFTHRYLAYTYAHARATVLTDLTRSLRRQLISRPPTVPASVRALCPHITSLALAHLTGGVWLATAQVTDGHNTYAIHSTLAHVRSRWVVRRVTAGG